MPSRLCAAPSPTGLSTPTRTWAPRDARPRGQDRHRSSQAAAQRSARRRRPRRGLRHGGASADFLRHLHGAHRRRPAPPPTLFLLAFSFLCVLRASVVTPSCLLGKNLCPSVFICGFISPLYAERLRHYPRRRLRDALLARQPPGAPQAVPAARGSRIASPADLPAGGAAVSSEPHLRRRERPARAAPPPTNFP